MAERRYGVVLGLWHLGLGKTQAPFTPDPLQTLGKGLQRSSFLLTFLPLDLPSQVQTFLGPTSVGPNENSEAKNADFPLPYLYHLVFALSMLLSFPVATSKTFSLISSSLVYFTLSVT